MQIFKYFQDKAYIINQLPIFSDLSDDEKKMVAELCQFSEYKKNELIYKQSSPPDKFYLIITGRVEVFSFSKNGKEEPLEYLRRGQFFGIISLLIGEPHSVSAKAINDSVILTIEKDNFDLILKKIPGLSFYFSQYLSRRLKRKDLHPKSVFESTIIAVFSQDRLTGKTLYSVNLALSLIKESNKKVILVDMSPQGNKIFSMLGEPAPKAINLNNSFFDEKAIKENRIYHKLGIDILGIEYSELKSEESFKIGALLSLLTNEYHYIILDLPHIIDSTISKTLAQSDLIHIITVAEEEYLKKTNSIIKEFKENLKSKSEDIKVIVNEYELKKSLPHSKRAEILGHQIYATLPDIELHLSFDKEKIVLDYPESSYAKAIRRIARDISHVLIGLALGCGGAMGLADIGILKVFEREKIPIDMISGTSIGAIIAGFWAAGFNSKDLENIFRKQTGKFSMFGLIDLVYPKSGFIKGKKIENFLKKYLGTKTFYDTKLPLKIIACDLVNRQEVVLDKGSLTSAIRASIAIPGVIQPLELDGRILVDGGIVNPVPTDVLIQSGASKIISVNSLPGPVASKNLRKIRFKAGIFDTIVISIQATEFIIGERSCEDSDIALRPILDEVEWFEFSEIDRLIKLGEETAEQFLPQIRQLSLDQ